MKNKEIEELLNNIKEQLIIDEKLGKEIAQDFHKTILNYEGTKLLLSYIEQLENNRDKAIEYINCKQFVDGIRIQDIPEKEELLNILKGDSDENRNV